MKCQIIIPARLASTRLPEKLLRTVDGKSILEFTYLAACHSTVAADVLIAVDDQRIADEADRIGAPWVMTNPNCASGTDRIAEVAAGLPDVDVFVNVQGDEPEIAAATIDLVAQTLLDDPEAKIATAAAPIRSADQLADPNCVKIVIDAGQGRASAGRAIYFSRSAVPHPRGGVTKTQLDAEPPLFWHHIGLYAYRRDFLTWFAAQPSGRIEQTEKLEQLRATEAGHKIVVARVTGATPGIDTEADLQAFALRYRQQQQQQQ